MHKLGQAISFLICKVGSAAVTLSLRGFACTPPTRILHPVPEALLVLYVPLPNGIAFQQALGSHHCPLGSSSLRSPGERLQSNILGYQSLSLILTRSQFPVSTACLQVCGGLGRDYAGPAATSCSPSKAVCGVQVQQ